MGCTVISRYSMIELSQEPPGGPVNKSVHDRQTDQQHTAEKEYTCITHKLCGLL
jgi:hypothetical protein